MTLSNTHIYIHARRVVCGSIFSQNVENHGGIMSGGELAYWIRSEYRKAFSIYAIKYIKKKKNLSEKSIVFLLIKKNWPSRS